ncbi:neutral amino acid transporter 9 isoform X2 [Leptinotarsa decemlineata]|uniref:neutral amino acid transporter 9 isoform X2 n=1 Tax=Leptinotarsa decemlineata TaxID=7539 RepID=UPI003D30BF64
MILYSSIAMRDLIRNYKMIIKGKNQDSDSDNEPLMSSTSSQGYGTSVSKGEPRMFKQENDSTESDDDPPIKAKPFIIQKIKSEITPHNFSKEEKVFDRNHDSMYDLLQQYSNYDELPSERTSLLTSTYKYGMEDIVSVEQAETPEKHTNISVITIFAIWNTTMGSSLLAMPWGIERSGLFAGIFIHVVVAALCLYSAYILLSISSKHGIPGANFDVADLCRLLIGQWAVIVSKIFSLVVLIGGDLVYWILMSNFMYNLVYFLHGSLAGLGDEQNEENVLCYKNVLLSLNSSVYTQDVPLQDTLIFDKIWSLYRTVPVFLAVLIFPLLNFKSPTFFTKFNSLGTISVAYLLIFVLVKSIIWGIHIPNWPTEFDIKPTFCILSGMLSMSYFIHSIVISIMRHNKHQENNGRDLTIAFFLVFFTYVFIGGVFFSTFPLAKNCIEDNLLNNFPKWDMMSIIARVLLFFQLFTVFPLITFMLRADILSCIDMVFKNKNFGKFSYLKTIIINCVIVFTCIMFACFLPRIGTLIRFTGALSGMVYIFLMPGLLNIASLKKEGALTTMKLVLNVALIGLGVLNLSSQFFMSE